MRKLVYAAGAIAVLAILGWWVSSGREAPKDFVWVDASKMTQEMRPGWFMRLKFKLLRLPGPFWRWYMSGRELIRVETRLLALSAGATQQAEPSSKAWSNQDGVRAWVLSPEDLKALRQRLDGSPGVSVANSFRLTTYDGGQAELSEGGPVAATTNLTFAGLTIGLLPKVVAGSFELKLVATSTRANPSPDVTVAAITNLIAACSALLPNGGGLVLASGASSFSPQTNYWIILSASAIDAQGRPKELRP